MFKKLLKETPNSLTEDEYKDLAERTDGYFKSNIYSYSGSDVATLVKDAAY